jgi:Domain of unknown function (DUF4173)
MTAATFPTTTAPPRRAILLLAALVVLADILFWDHPAGLPLALFGLAVFAASLLTLSRRVRPRPVVLVVLGLSVLPVVEFVQALSILFLTLGLITAIAMARLGPAAADTTLRAALALGRGLPMRGLRDAGAALVLLRPNLSPPGGLRQIVKAWAFPVGGTLILLSLLAEANPILDGWIADLTRFPVNPDLWLQRLLFWTGVALMVWPLVTSHPPVPDVIRARPGKSFDLGLSAASVSRALIAFNAVLALQTLLDARYLWSGATLPPGPTLAEYAQRGAYPLLAAALLAGGFALAARPFVQERKGLRLLLLLWLAQNIVLTLSALYRLDLYVAAFGLTYLRVHALIWMGLVAVGLALTLTQIALNRSNPWLVVRCGVLGIATLYTCAFINFADLIARTNVAMGKIDPLYLCQLGSTAAASVPPWGWGGPGKEIDLSSRGCTLTPPKIDGWRDWGFRNWRVLNSLAATEARP